MDGADLDLAPEELAIPTLGGAARASPLGLSHVWGDFLANYVPDEATVLLDVDRGALLRRLQENRLPPVFERAGPREKIFFDPPAIRAAVVTAGGLCPGINNVIRALVMELWHRYGVRTIYGVPYGFQGFIPEYGLETRLLTPEFVTDIHEKGGTILGSSRGPQETGRIVDWLERMQVSLLFAIGGDGTLRAAQDIHEEIDRRGRLIGVVGIPKTVDNDIAFVEKTFGLETAFAVAAQAIRSAHTEAVGSPDGIGLVKVMGRMSGFIAANSALAMNEVNFVLVPEIPFDLEGPAGLFRALEERLRLRRHAVVLVAEGAGQRYVSEAGSRRDASGNPLLGDIGTFLQAAIKRHFTEQAGISANIKYIDPSYLVRSVPANAHDSIYCMQLAHNAVHAGLAGKTGLIVGSWNGQFTHVPIRLAISRRKTLSPEEPLWLNVLEATGQPARMVNG